MIRLKNSQLYNFQLFAYTIARLRVALKLLVDVIDKTEKVLKSCRSNDMWHINKDAEYVFEGLPHFLIFPDE